MHPQVEAFQNDIKFYMENPEEYEGFLERNADALLQRVQAARTKITYDLPFFAACLLRWRQELEWAFGTACVDPRGFIKLNPVFVSHCTIDDLVFVLCHEVLHVLSLDHLRRESRHPTIWNMAADYIQNATLLDSGLPITEFMRNFGLFSEEYQDMTREQVYELLYKDTPKIKVRVHGDPGGGDGGSDGSGEGGEGDEEDDENTTTIDVWSGDLDDGAMEDMSPAEVAEVAREAKRVAAAAVSSAEAAGSSISGKLRRFVEEDVLKTKIPWSEYVLHWAQSMVVDGSSYTRLQRRVISQGIFLPAGKMPAIQHLVIGVDTSGSIGGEEMKQFAAQVSSICDDLAVAKITVLYCDVAVNKVEEYTHEELPISLTVPCEQGGTDLRAMNTYVANELEEAADGAIWLTDGYTEWPEEEELACPLFVVTTGATTEREYLPCVKIEV